MRDRARPAEGAEPPSIGIACFNLAAARPDRREARRAGRGGRRRSADGSPRRARAGARARSRGCSSRTWRTCRATSATTSSSARPTAPTRRGGSTAASARSGRAGGGRRLNVLVTRARRGGAPRHVDPARVYRALPPVPRRPDAGRRRGCCSRTCNTRRTSSRQYAAARAAGPASPKRICRDALGDRGERTAHGRTDSLGGGSGNRPSARKRLRAGRSDARGAAVREADKDSVAVARGWPKLAERTALAATSTGATMASASTSPCTTRAAPAM